MSCVVRTARDVKHFALSYVGSGRHCTGDWVGTSLDGTENLTTLGFDPQTMQPIVSGCIYCGIWAT